MIFLEVKNREGYEIEPGSRSHSRPSRPRPSDCFRGRTKSSSRKSRFSSPRIKSLVFAGDGGVVRSKGFL